MLPILALHQLLEDQKVGIGIYNSIYVNINYTDLYILTYCTSLQLAKPWLLPVKKKRLATWCILADKKRTHFQETNYQIQTVIITGAIPIAETHGFPAMWRQYRPPTVKFLKDAWVTLAYRLAACHCARVFGHRGPDSPYRRHRFKASLRIWAGVV